MHFRIVGFELEGAPEAGDGLDRLVPAFERHAKVVVRRRVVGIDIHDPLVTGRRPFQLSLESQDVAEVVVGVRIAGIDL